MAAVVRAFFGYCFLVFIVRVLGRRPGKQRTPFEFVLVFFIGGLALTAIVGKDPSFTGALTQIISIAAAHYVLAWARFRSSRFARLTDGTALPLLHNRQWHTEIMEHVGVNDDDVMASARDSGVRSLNGIETAILERNGEISIAPVKPAS